MLAPIQVRFASKKTDKPRIGGSLNLIIGFNKKLKVASVRKSKLYKLKTHKGFWMVGFMLGSKICLDRCRAKMECLWIWDV